MMTSFSAIDPFVISASILGLEVKRVLIDQCSSINLMFQDLLPKLGISISDLDTYLIVRLEALVTYGHGKRSQTIKTTFVVLPLITPYHCNVGRPTLDKIGAVASAVHLRIKFHSLTGEVVIISADINSAECTQYLSLRGTRSHLQNAPEPTRASEHVLLTEVDARNDPKSSEDESDDELARELKKKNKLVEPGGEFIKFLLRDDPTKTVKLGDDLPEAVREGLIACLQ